MFYPSNCMIIIIITRNKLDTMKYCELHVCIFSFQKIRTYIFKNLNSLNLCYLSATYHLCKNLFRLTWENAGS